MANLIIDLIKCIINNKLNIRVVTVFVEREVIVDGIAIITHSGRTVGLGIN